MVLASQIDAKPNQYVIVIQKEIGNLFTDNPPFNKKAPHLYENRCSVFYFLSPNIFLYKKTKKIIKKQKKELPLRSVSRYKTVYYI
jgi:hypothetical protein